MAKKQKSYKELYEELQDLKQQVKEAKIEEQKNERVWEKHAKIVWGGMIAQCFEGSDWKKVDTEKLNQYLKQWHRQIAQQCGADEKRTPGEANQSVKAFEKRVREAKKRAKEAESEQSGTNEQ